MTTANIANGNGHQQPYVESTQAGFESVRTSADAAGRQARGLQNRGGWRLGSRSRPSARSTATPVANRGIWRYAAALSEFESPFLNGLQRSVNRKVQGSNPWLGANVMSQVEADRCLT